MAPWVWTLSVGEHKSEDACSHGASALVGGTDTKKRVSASDGCCEENRAG